MAAIRPKALAKQAAAPQVAVDTAATAAPPTLDPSNPALAAILAEVATGGSHTRPWGELRRKLFPGEAGWTVLQRWCAEHSITCALYYGNSSRSAEVEFNSARPRPER